MIETTASFVLSMPEYVLLHLEEALAVLESDRTVDFSHMKTCAFLGLDGETSACMRWIRNMDADVGVSLVYLDEGKRLVIDRSGTFHPRAFCLLLGCVLKDCGSTDSHQVEWHVHQVDKDGNRIPIEKNARPVRAHALAEELSAAYM